MVTQIDDILRTHLDNQFGFKYRVIEIDLEPKEQLKEINTLTHNALFFQLEGRLSISWGAFKNVEIKAGEMYFLPRGAVVSACVLDRSAKYIAVRLDHDIDNTRVFNALLRSQRRTEDFDYVFKPLEIRDTMKIFLDSVSRYAIDVIKSEQLNNLKLLELYIIFNNYYTKEECVNLFYPIVKRDSKFKSFILDNYKVSVTIEELVQKANMSRSTFDRTFKENFGTTPLKWIDIQTRILIMRKAAEPNVTVKDMMYDVGVYNPSQFTQLCKRLCGVTPSKLIHRA